MIKQPLIQIKGLSKAWHLEIRRILISIHGFPEENLWPRLTHSEQTCLLFLNVTPAIFSQICARYKIRRCKTPHSRGYRWITRPKRILRLRWLIRPLRNYVTNADYRTVVDNCRNKKLSKKPEMSF